MSEGWTPTPDRAVAILDVAGLPTKNRTPDRWPEPLGEAAFHGVVGDAVRAIEPHTEADPAAILVQLLVCFGSAVGRRPAFRVEADRHGTNLFAAVVADSSKGRKGSSFGQAHRLIELADGTWGNRVASGASSGEGLIWQVRDPITTRRKPKKGETPGEDGLVEELVDEGVSDKRLLLYESELASVLARMGQQANTLSAVMRQAWDGGRLSTLTKNSPARATDAHISVIAHITEEELRRELTATETANGFGNRFLWVCARRSKLLPEGGALHTVDLRPIVTRLTDAVNFARSMPGTKDGIVGLDPDARELWHDRYAALSEGAPGILGAATSRAEAQVRRLALVYAVLDCSHVVTIKHLAAGFAVWDYCHRSARHLFGTALGDPLADRIENELRDAGPKGLTKTDIYGKFGGHRKAAEVDHALSVLKAASRATDTRKSTRGRPAEVWVHSHSSLNSHNPSSSPRPRNDAGPSDLTNGEESEVSAKSAEGARR